jgi:glyceraldehyde-3-phosphate dehydrogenase/erythrose-4-phosphate dehydrogenase
MIIDNPHVLREVIEETKPYFTHKGAEEIVTTLKEKMDEYAARYGILADQVWKEEYLREPSATTTCASSNIRQTPRDIGISMSMKSN